MDIQDDLDVPVKLRSVEQKQLEDYGPMVLDALEDATLEDEAAEMRDIVETIEDWDGERSATTHVRTLSLTFDEWATLIRNLERIEGSEGVNRILYLRHKLFTRVQERARDLGAEL